MSAARRPASSADRFLAAGRSRRRDADTGQAPERGRTAIRTRPVRITVDLPPEDYRMMQRLVMELATATDIPTLAHSVMWRTLLHQVESDPNLLTAIAHRIRADRD